ESEFKEYTSLEEYMKTLEGSTYYHGLLLRAVNHPIRKEILKIVNELKKISHTELFRKLKNKGILEDQNILSYNLDYLIKAICIKIIRDETSNEIYYEITQSGQVVEWI
ncbi:MAG: hypothetical protein ACFFAO_06075, partial [Candidatus Hermodarchaeota archaeon]